MLQADRSAESAGRLENLAELTRAMEEYKTLQAFLEHVSLVMDNDEARQGDRVTIMTIHAAKGLEFDRVYLPGWEEGVFPSQRSLDEGGLASLEEERRLAHWGVGEQTTAGGEGLRRQPWQPGPHRSHARTTRVPWQVRLRHHRRNRGEQAGNRFRARWTKEGAGQLRDRRLIQVGVVRQ